MQAFPETTRQRGKGLLTPSFAFCDNSRQDVEIAKPQRTQVLRVNQGRLFRLGLIVAAFVWLAIRTSSQTIPSGFFTPGEQPMLKSILAAMAVGLLAFVGGSDDTVKLDGVKCIMMPNKAVKADKSVEYRGAKVYLCCDGCVKKFKADDAKTSTMANHQLALTGQFTQKACPISGGAAKDDQSLEVGGVKVNFCCGNCKGKVEKAADLAEKAKLCFANEAFDKGFEAKKKAAK
jgi:hypothetical protein